MAVETEKQEQEKEQPQPTAEGGQEETVESLKARLAAKEKESQEHYGQLLRSLADLDNYKKRAAKDRAELIKAAVVPVFLEILPVLDNLERALAAAKTGGKETDRETLIKGVEITLVQFKKTLEKLGVQPLETAGKAFDPYFHEALTHVETEEHAPDSVAEEVQKGYLLEGKVLRPAVVKVAKKPEKSSQ